MDSKIDVTTSVFSWLSFALAIICVVVSALSFHASSILEGTTPDPNPNPIPDPGDGDSGDPGSPNGTPGDDVPGEGDGGSEEDPETGD